MISLREMSLGRPTQPFYLETSILFFFEQLNKAGIYNNLTKAMLYIQIKDHDSPHSQFFSGVSDMRWCLSNYSKSLENSVCRAIRILSTLFMLRKILIGI